MRGRKPQVRQPTQSEFPSSPEWLSDDARKEWNRLLEMIGSAGAVARPDADVLAAYCETIALYRQALQQIRDEGLTYSGETGIKRHPAVAIASDARKDLLRLAAELGLTPVSRQRLKIEDVGKDELAEFIADGQPMKLAQ